MVRTTLSGFFQFERLLALVLFLIPVGLWIGGSCSGAELFGWDETCVDSGVERGSISSFHDMADAKWFYLPLGIGAVMFVINGLVRPEKHGYNAFLGLWLFGLVWFDHDGWSNSIHVFSAVVFFVSASILAIAQWSDVLREKAQYSLAMQRLFFVTAIALVAAVAWLLNWRLGTVSAEWFLLLPVCLHYYFHATLHRRFKTVKEPDLVLDELIPGFKVVRQAIGRFAGPVWPDRVPLK